MIFGLPPPLTASATLSHRERDDNSVRAEHAPYTKKANDLYRPSDAGGPGGGGHPGGSALCGPPAAAGRPPAHGPFCRGHGQSHSHARSLLRRVLLLASPWRSWHAGTGPGRAAPGERIALCPVGEGQAVRGASAAAATGCLQPASRRERTARTRPWHPSQQRARRPAHHQGPLSSTPPTRKTLRVRSADMVAAALVGDTVRPKKVWRRIDFKRTNDETILPSDIEVEFWAGFCPPVSSGIQIPCYVLVREGLGMGARRRRPAV